MAIDKPAARSPSRAAATRRRVLQAAERLLRSGRPAFSMRDLADEADVSFATPFNQFGSKSAIMHALSADRIAEMGERFRDGQGGGDAIGRVLAAVEIAAAVMLEEPEVNRAVIGTLGAATDTPGRVYPASRALWAEALGSGEGVDPEVIGLALSALPDQLAVAFRGVLSFWTAGEIDDAALAPRARAAASALLLGFVSAENRSGLLRRLRVPGEGSSEGG